MKFIFFKKRNRIVSYIFSFCILFVVLLNMVGYFFDLKYISVIAAMEETNQYEIRSRLLMEAMNEVGVCKPEKAAEVWANGLKQRSGAMQYSVMSKALKEEYAKQLQQNFPNWVTGISSPWVESFEIIKKEKTNNNQYIYQLRIDTKTSTGPAGSYHAELTIEQEGDFWRITKIKTDPELSVYTGFNLS